MKYKRRRFKLLHDFPNADKGDIFVEGLTVQKGEPIPNKKTLYKETLNNSIDITVAINDYETRVKDFDKWFEEIEPFEFYL